MATACPNPRCDCNPCTCTVCRCGTTRLGALERRVMDVLWASSGRPLTVKEVAAQLDGYAYTTIATVLDRLARKGELRRERHGQILSFTATETGAAHTARAMREVLDQSDDPVGAIARLGAMLSDEELASMQRAVKGSTKRGARHGP